MRTVKKSERPLNGQSYRDAHRAAIKARNIDFSRRERTVSTSYKLFEGMSRREVLTLAVICAIAIALGFCALNTFGWAIGHFMKGWW